MTGQVIPFAPRKWHCDKCRDLGEIGSDDAGWRFCSCPLGVEMAADFAGVKERIWLKVAAAIRDGETGGAA